MKNNRTWMFSVGLIVALCSSDTVVGQTNTLTANPPQLTFNTENGVTTPLQSVLLSSSSAPETLFVSAYSDTGWLTVTPSSGTTPLVLSVSIGAGAPTFGTDVGFINVSTAGGTPQSLQIPVTLNANAKGAASPISASPNSLSFVFPQGSTAATQTVTLSSSSSTVTTFTATAINDSNTPFSVSVSPTSGGLPGTVQVTVNPVGSLSLPGTFDAAVAINAPGTNGITIPILATIQGTPTLNVTPATLSFGFQQNTALPAPQTLTLTSSTGANISYTALAEPMNCGNWIVLNQSSGATPSTLSVSVNTAGLGVGTCTGNVVISPLNAANPTNITIPVSLLVSNLPLIQAPATGPTFTYQIGGAVPGSQQVQITSTTAGLNVGATATPNTGQPNFLQITPATGVTPQAFTLGINPSVLANLAPGTYTETVTLSGSGAGNAPQTFTVTLTVSSNPSLISSVPSINFNYEVGQAAPSSQTFTVSSNGAPLNFQVAANTTSCPGFLTATPTAGNTLTSSQSQVVVSVSTQNLTTPQVCNGNVTLTVPGSTVAPLVIPVTFNVAGTTLLNVSQGSINVTALTGAAAITKTISVTSTDSSAVAFSATETTSPAGLSWLAVAPNSGNTPNNLVVTINPAGLGVGTYTGTIVVSSTASTIPSQTIPVTLTVYGSTAATSESMLTFTQATGGAAPASQSVTITGVPTGGTIGALTTTLSGSSTNWLTATTAGNTVTVAVNGAPLAQGNYSGIVTVIVPGALGSPINIPVALDVTAATSPITLSGNTASFNVQAGSMSVPTSTQIQVTSTTSGASAPFSASFVPTTGGNFLTVTPTSGNTPATLTLAVNSAVSSTLAAGSYTGTVQVFSGTGAVQMVTVTLVVSPTGTPVVLAVTSGASLQPSAISPGEIVTIFGNSIGPATPALGTSFTVGPNDTVATTLAGVTVTFNKVAAPLLFVSPGQINAVVPYEVAGQTTVPVVVTNNGTASASFTAAVTAVAPEIFALSQTGSGQGAILNSDSSVNGTGNPAAPGSVIQIFGTGEGAATPPDKTGCITGGTPPFPRPVANVSVTIGGEAASVSYAGEAPDLVCGVIQVNAMVPADLSAGAQPVLLTIGTSTNNTQMITVAVK